MRLIVTTLAIAGLTALSACSAEQTEEGELPDVDVNASGGNLPEYDVQTEDVDVQTEEAEVTVPTIETGDEAEQ